jgi:hypothetical protein
VTDPERHRRSDLVISVFVLGVWLRDFGSISCLFRARPETVAYFHIQVRRGGAWVDIDERAFFPMHPFGHRSRFDRFMERWGGRSEPARADLARWLAVRDRALFPGLAPIEAVRFYAGNHPIRADDPPRGHWRKPALDPGRERLLSTHEVAAEAP